MLYYPLTEMKPISIMNPNGIICTSNNWKRFLKNVWSPSRFALVWVRAKSKPAVSSAPPLEETKSTSAPLKGIQESHQMQYKNPPLRGGPSLKQAENSRDAWSTLMSINHRNTHRNSCKPDVKHLPDWETPKARQNTHNKEGQQVLH